jgi:hypothetical protein
MNNNGCDGDDDDNNNQKLSYFQWEKKKELKVCFTGTSVIQQYAVLKTPQMKSRSNES